MAKHYTIEDLSAYLDGEHRQPTAVRQHLESCEDCAGHYIALERQSTVLGALPGSEVTHGFTDRVMRACTEQPIVRYRPRFRFLTPLVAAAAALAAGVFGYAALTSDFDAIDSGIVLQAEIDLETEQASQAVPTEYYAGDYTATVVSLDEEEKDTLMVLLATSLLDDNRM